MWFGAQAQVAVGTAPACPGPFDLDLKNREVAGLAWLGVALAALLLLSLWDRNVGRALLTLIGSLFQKAFLVLGAVTGAWILAGIALLARVDLWRWDNLKTTVVWAVTSVPVAVYEYERAKAGKAFFADGLAKSFGLAVFGQFLVDEFSFPLWAELLILPALVFVALIQAVAARNPDHRSVERLAGGVIVVAGLVFVVNAIVGVVADIRDFARYETLREFLVPVLLTLFYLPVVYALAVYATYETSLLRLNWAIRDDAGLRAYARWRAIRTFGLDLERLRRWSRDVAMGRPETRSEVRAIMVAVNRAAAQEAHSPPVFADEGWSPFAAKAYLEDHGFRTGDYHAYGGEWYAGSQMVDLGDAPLPDNLTYYVEGGPRVATRLRLKLNINNPGQAERSRARFRDLAEILLKNATGEAFTAEREIQLARLEPGRFVVGTAQVRLILEPYPGDFRGYTLTLELTPTGERPSA